MQEGLVSIITPAYNLAGLIGRLLESVLTQDYPTVEMLVVDDGSADNTKDVVTSYIPKFKEKNYVLEYQYQENQGQSVAINNALKWVKGEYLLWPDADDFYSRPDSISTYVQTFKTLSEDYGMVRSTPKYVDEYTLKEIPKVVNTFKGENQFENALYNNGFPWAGYMIRIAAFDATNPSREIYTNKRAGQNWQMVLPLLYSYKCFTLEDALFSVLVRTGSHSRQNYRAIENVICHIEVYEDTVLHTLERINEMMPEVRQEYIRQVKLKYAHEKLIIACGYTDRENARKYKDIIIGLDGELSLTEKIRYFLSYFPMLYKLLKRIQHNND